MKKLPVPTTTLIPSPNLVCLKWSKLLKIDNYLTFFPRYILGPWHTPKFIFFYKISTSTVNPPDPYGPTQGCPSLILALFFRKRNFYVADTCYWQMSTQNESKNAYRCIYFSALSNLNLFLAFSNCNLLNGGDKCIKAIKAGSHCFTFAGNFIVDNELLETTGNPKNLNYFWLLNGSVSTQCLTVCADKAA